MDLVGIECTRLASEKPIGEERAIDVQNVNGAGCETKTQLVFNSGVSCAEMKTYPSLFLVNKEVQSQRMWTRSPGRISV